MTTGFLSLQVSVETALVAGAILMAVAAPSPAQDGSESREVPFLTLRDRTGSENPAEAYGDARSDLSAGWCRVEDVDLRFLAPLAESAPSYVREELLRVDEVKVAESAAVLDDLEASIQDGGPVIFVHGYYISFEKGCRRAALLTDNAGLAGRFLWFSWPSDGALTNYAQDEADLYWSVPDLAEAILELERRFGAGVVDVAGHSLGARGVALALYEVANRNPEAHLDEIVLLAPDMDFGIFERMLPRIRPIAENITVYVTTGDRPLTLSAQLHGYPRLGEAGNDVSQLEGVEVIDLSQLPVESPTGHQYHIHSTAVGEDLHQLLNEGKHAAERRNLERTGQNRWTVQPDGGRAQE